MKTKTAVLNGRPDAGNPHVRFDEGVVASAKPSAGGPLLYKSTNVVWTLMMTCILAVQSSVAATSSIIVEEDFEGAMSCHLSSVGSFPVSPGIKSGMGVNGSNAYGFGRSSCGSNAWDGYVNDLVFRFSKKYVITKVEFWEIERYGNWGSQGWLIANGNQIPNTTFGRLPSNDHVADSSFRKREFAINVISDGITLRCWDITNESELFVDAIKIYGYVYDGSSPDVGAPGGDDSHGEDPTQGDDGGGDSPGSDGASDSSELGGYADGHGVSSTSSGLIVYERFESAMSCKLSSTGQFPVSPGMKHGMGVGGSRAYGFGRSSCGSNAWDGYVNRLTFSFSRKYVITRVEFYEMERYENWGSEGFLSMRGSRIADTTFARLPGNDRIADTEFRKREFELSLETDELTFACRDITNLSELFIDEIKIFGYPVNEIDATVELKIESASAVSDELTLSWSGEGLGEATFSIYRRASEGGAWECVAKDLKGRTFTQKGFSNVEPLCSEVEYYVAATIDGKDVGHSNIVVTRKRWGLAVGYSSYERILIFGKPWVDPLSQALSDATEFRRLCLTTGGFSSSRMVLLSNDSAKTSDIRASIHSAVMSADPGDVFVFYIATHGGFNLESKTVAGLCTYGISEYYDVGTLQSDLRSFNSGVRVVAIIMACHSSAVAGIPTDDGNLAMYNQWIANAGFAQCVGNIAWIASCGHSESSYNSDQFSMFGESFVNNGWSKGFADASNLNNTEYTGNGDQWVSFLELGHYVEIFNRGLSDLEPSTVAIENENILASVIAGSCSRAFVRKVGQPILNVEAMENAVKIFWDPVDNASMYRLYRGDDASTHLCVSYVVKGNSYVDSANILLRKPYVYRVQAYNPGGFGSFSLPIETQTKDGELTAFLRSKCGLTSQSSEEYEAARRRIGANGVTYEESFVAGLDPEKRDSQFEAKITFENGKPVVTYEPDLGVSRCYRTLGSKDMKNWIEVDPGREGEFNFFKVSVRLNQ